MYHDHLLIKIVDAQSACHAYCVNHHIFLQVIFISLPFVTRGALHYLTP